MFKNNFKIAWRQIIRQKMYSVIKIGGFSLGIAACFLITLYILDELRYDQHYADKENIYRVIEETEYMGKDFKNVWFPAPLAQVLENDFAEIEKAGRYNNAELFGSGSKEVRRTDRKLNFYETRFTYMDQKLFDILQYQLLSGSPGKVLSNRTDLVISQRKAEKYFPDEDPIGKTLILNNDEEQVYTIRGVMENPEAIHFQYDFIMSLAGVEFWPGEQNFWGAQNYPTYIKVQPGTDIHALEDKLEAIEKNYLMPAWKQSGELNIEEKAKKTRMALQPVADIHLYSADIEDMLSHGDIRFVWLFGGIAAFILLIAGINFINLSTAKSANRAMEVGLRKTVGSTRRHLVSQFLIESTLFSFLSFSIGILLAYFLLPYFNLLSTKSLVMPWTEWWLWPVLLLSTLTVGILAGLYPSFYLSSFKPIHVLKGKLSRGSKTSTLRNALVIFQFTTSIALIIGTFVIYSQVNYILNKKVGFDKDQVVMLHGANTLEQSRSVFKEKLLQLSSVKSVSISDYLPIDGSMRNNNGFVKAGKEGEEEPVFGQIWRVDHDYIKTLGMKVIEGRDFSSEVLSDSSAMIINRKMARELGFENPIGEKVENFELTRTVIGVIEDFHFESMKGEIRPLCMVLGNSPKTMSLKVTNANMAETLESINLLWDEFSPNQPIRYSFLDEKFAAMYSDVKQMGQIFGTFAILAIIVACLGLFALSAFMVEQRSKEISIRLVLGASLRSVLSLLTLNFVKLIIISILIAAPLAWYAMQMWLQDFTYRTEIGPGIFILSGSLAIAIALVTISYQSIRAALANPVEQLRSE
ncbi:FtsX-like permease family protein [Fulvivirga sp. M361]|nr:FtsX-like permease family protein [Fulvivirga sp. M361]